MKVHFIGIGGRAMGGIAIALARSGHRVTGSDQQVYEPMQSLLRREGIVPTLYASEHVPDDADAVVAGRRIRADNPELQRVLEASLPLESFPSFLERLFLSRSRNAVVAGGVGKTTTTALLAWILEHSGQKPDYLIGGRARNFDHSARFDEAPIAVMEGDEYASGVDDDRPKFLHYAPELVAITNVLVDHPDLYPDASSLMEAFAALVRLLPAHGRLVLGSDEEGSDVLASLARCPVVKVGLREDADQRIEDVELSIRGSAFSLGGSRFQLPLHGLVNVHNAAIASVSAAHFGISFDAASRALALFEGVEGRQDAREAGGRTLIRDKASHPRSLQHLAAALRQRYEGRRLLSVMQPRATGGRRWIYQRDLPGALAGFDGVLLAHPYEHAPPPNIPWRDEPFSLDLLNADLQSLGTETRVVSELDDLPAAVREWSRPGDVVLLSLREQFASVGTAIERSLSAAAPSTHGTTFCENRHVKLPPP